MELSDKVEYVCGLKKTNVAFLVAKVDHEGPENTERM